MLSLLKQFNFLLERRAKRQAVLLCGIMLLGAVFEGLGVGLVFPFIAIVTDPTIIETNGTLSRIFLASGLETQRQFVMAATVVLLVLFIVKNLYIAFQQYAQFAFSYRSQVNLSSRLLKHYLRSPYAFHLRRNSAELLRNVNSEALWIFHQVMVPLLGVLSESFVVLLIALVLMWVAPLATLWAFLLLGGASGLFYWMIRSRARDYGKAQQTHMGQMIQWVNQGLGSIKDTKVKGKEDYFIDQYTQSSEAYAQANIYLKTVSALPRLTIEVFGVGAILVTSFAMVAQGRDMMTLLPYLGLFAMAAFRMMPSINRILTSLTGMRFFEASVDAVYTDMATASPASQPLPSHTTGVEEGRSPSPVGSVDGAIEVDHVTFSYADRKDNALDNVALRIERGSAIGFAGTSGSGKSTLIDIILGLLEPQSGRMLVDGMAIQTNLAGWQHTIGYIPQSTYLLDDTIRRNVAFGLVDSEIDDEHVWEALRAARLEEFVRSLDEGLEVTVGENGVRVSGGQKQRLGIARALYTDPAVLVLDEATSALDAEIEREIINEVFELKGDKTLLIVAHRLATLSGCDTIFLIKEGKIAGSGTFEQLNATDPYFQSLLHDSLHTVQG